MKKKSEKYTGAYKISGDPEISGNFSVLLNC